MNVERGKIEKFNSKVTEVGLGLAASHSSSQRKMANAMGDSCFITKLRFIVVRDGHESDLGSTLEPRTPAVSVLSRLNVHNWTYFQWILWGERDVTATLNGSQRVLCLVVLDEWEICMFKIQEKDKTRTVKPTPMTDNNNIIQTYTYKRRTIHQNRMQDNLVSMRQNCNVLFEGRTR
jgi:hypothetical protein